MLYLLLAATGLAVLAYNLRRSPPLPVLGAAFMSCLVIGFGDLIAHDILRLYLYLPGLHPVLGADEHLGLLLADLIGVPGLMSTLGAVSARKRWWVALFLAAVLNVHELLFLALGQFAYNGWRFWYSVAGFPLYTLGIAWWTTLLERHGYRGLWRLAMIVAACAQLVEPWANLSTAVLGTWAVRPRLLPASLPDRSLGMYAIYQTPMVLFIALVVGLGWTRSVVGYAAIWFGAWCWLSLLEGLGMLHHAAFWDGSWEALVLTGLAWGVARVDALLTRDNRVVA